MADNEVNIGWLADFVLHVKYTRLVIVVVLVHAAPDLLMTIANKLLKLGLQKQSAGMVWFVKGLIVVVFGRILYWKLNYARLMSCDHSVPNFILYNGVENLFLIPKQD